MTEITSIAEDLLPGSPMSRIRAEIVGSSSSRQARRHRYPAMSR